MPHVDPETLALLAMGEQVASESDRIHLEACLECRQEVDVLARAAVVGRSTLDAGELVHPPDRVWSRISEELSLAGEPSMIVAPADAIVTPIGRRRPSRPRRILAIVMAAAAVLVIGGGLVTWSALRPSAPQVLASADLTAFPTWQGAAGTAKLEKVGDGAKVVQVSLDVPADAAGSGYREVWLMNADVTRLVSLGVMRGSSATFTLPDGIDMSTYDFVDVSAEPYDGNPQHSGDSILRGQLS